MSGVGGLVGQGFGKQVPAPRFVPPSAVHSSAVVSSHSAPSSSARQHCTLPWSSPSSGISVSITSSPWSSLTSISLPGGSTPRGCAFPGGGLPKRAAPAPAVLVVRLPIRTPATLIPYVVPGFRLRPRTRNVPRFRLAWIDATAMPSAFASTPVGCNGCLIVRAPVAGGTSTTTARARLHESTNLRISISFPQSDESDWYAGAATVHPG